MITVALRDIPALQCTKTLQPSPRACSEKFRCYFGVYVTSLCDVIDSSRTQPLESLRTQKTLMVVVKKDG